MRNIRCEEILKRSDFQGITDNDFEEQVSRYCIEKMNEYETAPAKIENLKEYPEKRYEIFKLNFDSGAKKIFILDTNLINYNDDINEKELYYSRIIAKRICENMKRLTEDAIIGISELEQMYKDEIDDINEKIKELKELDENEYNLDRFVYNSLKDTSIIEEVDNLKSQDEEILNENKILKEKLKKSEDTILELSNKLKISLEDIQKNREKLQLNTTSRFEKFINYIKNFLK
jgi:hypothetical protein